MSRQLIQVNSDAFLAPAGQQRAPEFAWLRLVLGLLLTLSYCQSGLAQNDDNEDEPLPLFDDLEVPTTAQLLTEQPVDWLVLKPDNRVLMVRPISQRPDTLVKMAAAQEALRNAATRPKRDAGESAEEYRERIAKLLDESENLVVALPDLVAAERSDGADEYTLNAKRLIERIIYHEDLMLQRADIQMNEGELEKAFEMLLVLQRREPGWPGYTERRNRLVFEEAKKRLRNNDLEAALAFFEELYVLAPGYGGLRNGIGSTIEALVARSVANERMREARYYIGRLRKSDPEHPTAKQLSEEFLARAGGLLENAQGARSEEKHDVALAETLRATKVWPKHPSLRSIFRATASRYQILSMGVYRFPGDKTPFFLPTAADQRRQSLLSTDLFEVRKIDRAAFYESRYFEEWTPTDLGREIVFSLRPRRAIWESNPMLIAPDVVRAIQDRLNPDSLYYDERMSTFVKSLQVHSPHEFSIQFSTVPVRPQAIFRFPVRQPTIASAAAPSSTSEATTDNSDAAQPVDPVSSILSRRFRIHEETKDKVSFRRVIPQGKALSRYRVAEIVEQRYKDHKEAIKGLLTGDVSVLPEVPIWMADQFEAEDDFFTEPYGVPTTHVLQFNPESKSLKNSEFRRALAYVINREKILAETILRDPTMKRGRVVSAPFPSTSYAYRAQTKPRPYDLYLAYSLKTVSKKKFGGEVPDLTMVCEPGEVIAAAAEALVSQWDRIGIKVRIVGQDEALPEDWDIVYRTVRMTEPVTELWPFLTMKQDARVEDLEHLPDWLRQQLIELEQAVDFNTSVEMLQRLHFRLHQLVHMVPLWEIDDVIVIRNNIQGFPAGMIHPYQNVERWIVQPWYPNDLL
ncbi:MAG: ABC transporter substrate-binding protein [Planctomycetales bacterium]